MSAPKLAIVTLAIAAGLVGTAPLGRADQLFVCTACTSPPSPADPNFLGDGSSINIGFAGNHAAVAPLLVIVGVPNGGAAPTLSLTGVSAAPAGSYYGLNAATSGGLTGVLEGALTSTPGSADAYTNSGLTPGGGNSDNFSNWAGTTFPNGTPNPDAGVTSFALYAFAIDIALNSGPGGNSPLTGISFAGAGNSFVVAYNCAVNTSRESCTGGNIGVTPFTQAGFIDLPSNPPPTLPEPSSLAILGSALALLGLVFRRVARKNGLRNRGIRLADPIPITLEGIAVRRRVKNSDGSGSP